MRKLLTIFAALAIAVGAIGVAPKTVEATGNCSVAYIILFEHSNYGGRSAKICYGVNDTDFISYPRSTSTGVGYFGKTATGTLVADFDSSNSWSGISSFKLWFAGGSNVRLCMYYNKNYNLQMFNETTIRWNPGFNILENDRGGSLRWISASLPLC